MKFIKIENLGEHVELILNIENIVSLIKNKKFKINMKPFSGGYCTEDEEIKGEFEYFLGLKNNASFQISKEHYELIKNKIGL